MGSFQEMFLRICIFYLGSAVAVARCNAPTAPGNGFIVSNDNTTVEFACDSGYSLIGSPFATCIDKTWNRPAPSCILDCTDPGTPVGGSQTGSPTYEAYTTVNFECDLGYSLIGAPTTTCLSGVWSLPVPTCQADCSDPGTPENGVQVGSPTYLDGTTVSFQCSGGFSLIGASTLTCQGGFWSHEIPQCAADCLDPGTPMDGSQSGSYGHGDTVTFSCESGFSLIGADVLTCSGGTWSNSVPICAADCSDPGTPTNGSQSGTYNHGDTVLFACDDGFSLTGADMISCEGGDWSNNVPMCNADCSDPGTPENGQQSGTYGYGDIVRFTCNDGYTLIGAAMITCLGLDYDDSVPLCFANCADPGIPDNGDYTGGFEHGDVLVYTCDDGYNLIGASQITCNNGNYTMDVPTCQAIANEEPAAATESVSAAETTLFSSTITPGVTFVADLRTTNNINESTTLGELSTVVTLASQTDFEGKTVDFMTGMPTVEFITSVPATEELFTDDFTDTMEDFTETMEEFTETMEDTTEEEYTMEEGTEEVTLPDVSITTKSKPPMPTRPTPPTRSPPTRPEPPTRPLPTKPEPPTKPPPTRPEPPTRPPKPVCPPIEHPVQGQQCAVYYHGDKMSFSCLPGFVLVGPDWIICLNGEWSGPVPSCQRTCGPHPPPPEHGFAVVEPKCGGKELLPPPTPPPMLPPTGYQPEPDNPYRPSITPPPSPPPPLPTPVDEMPDDPSYEDTPVRRSKRAVSEMSERPLTGSQGQGSNSSPVTEANEHSFDRPVTEPNPGQGGPNCTPSRGEGSGPGNERGRPGPTDRPDNGRPGSITTPNPAPGPPQHPVYECGPREELYPPIPPSSDPHVPLATWHPSPRKPTFSNLKHFYHKIKRILYEKFPVLHQILQSLFPEEYLDNPQWVMIKLLLKIFTKDSDRPSANKEIFSLLNNFLPDKNTLTWHLEKWASDFPSEDELYSQLQQLLAIMPDHAMLFEMVSEFIMEMPDKDVLLDSMREVLSGMPNQREIADMFNQFVEMMPDQVQLMNLLDDIESMMPTGDELPLMMEEYLSYLPDQYTLNRLIKQKIPSKQGILIMMENYLKEIPNKDETLGLLQNLTSTIPSSEENKNYLLELVASMPDQYTLAGLIQNKLSNYSKIELLEFFKSYFMFIPDQSSMLQMVYEYILPLPELQEFVQNITALVAMFPEKEESQEILVQYLKDYLDNEGSDLTQFFQIINEIVKQQIASDFMEGMMNSSMVDMLPDSLWDKSLSLEELKTFIILNLPTETEVVAFVEDYISSQFGREMILNVSHAWIPYIPSNETASAALQQFLEYLPQQSDMSQLLNESIISTFYDIFGNKSVSRLWLETFNTSLLEETLDVVFLKNATLLLQHFEDIFSSQQHKEWVKKFSDPMTVVLEFEKLLENMPDKKMTAAELRNLTVTYFSKDAISKMMLHVLDSIPDKEILINQTKMMMSALPNQDQLKIKLQQYLLEMLRYMNTSLYVRLSNKMQGMNYVSQVQTYAIHMPDLNQISSKTDEMINLYLNRDYIKYMLWETTSKHPTELQPLFYILEGMVEKIPDTENLISIKNKIFSKLPSREFFMDISHEVMWQYYPDENEIEDFMKLILTKVPNKGDMKEFIDEFFEICVFDKELFSSVIDELVEKVAINKDDVVPKMHQIIELWPENDVLLTMSDMIGDKFIPDKELPLDLLKCAMLYSEGGNSTSNSTSIPGAELSLTMLVDKFMKDKIPERDKITEVFNELSKKMPKELLSEILPMIEDKYMLRKELWELVMKQLFARFVLTDAEIEYLINDFVEEFVPDEQISMDFLQLVVSKFAVNNQSICNLFEVLEIKLSSYSNISLSFEEIFTEVLGSESSIFVDMLFGQELLSWLPDDLLSQDILENFVGMFQIETLIDRFESFVVDFPSEDELIVIFEGLLDSLPDQYEFYMFLNQSFAHVSETYSISAFMMMTLAQPDQYDMYNIIINYISELPGIENITLWFQLQSLNSTGQASPMEVLTSLLSTLPRQSDFATILENTISSLPDSHFVLKQLYWYIAMLPSNPPGMDLMKEIIESIPSQNLYFGMCDAMLNMSTVDDWANYVTENMAASREQQNISAWIHLVSEQLPSKEEMFNAIEFHLQDTPNMDEVLQWLLYEVVESPDMTALVSMLQDHVTSIVDSGLLQEMFSEYCDMKQVFTQIMEAAFGIPRDDLMAFLPDQDDIGQVIRAILVNVPDLDQLLALKENILAQLPVKAEILSLMREHSEDFPGFEDILHMLYEMIVVTSREDITHNLLSRQNATWQIYGNHFKEMFGVNITDLTWENISSILMAMEEKRNMWFDQFVSLIPDEEELSAILRSIVTELQLKESIFNASSAFLNQIPDKQVLSEVIWSTFSQLNEYLQTNGSILMLPNFQYLQNVTQQYISFIPDQETTISDFYGLVDVLSYTLNGTDFESMIPDREVFLLLFDNLTSTYPYFEDDSEFVLQLIESLPDKGYLSEYLVNVSFALPEDFTPLINMTQEFIKSLPEKQQIINLTQVLFSKLPGQKFDRFLVERLLTKYYPDVDQITILLNKIMEMMPTESEFMKFVDEMLQKNILDKNLVLGVVDFLFEKYTPSQEMIDGFMQMFAPSSPDNATIFEIVELITDYVPDKEVLAEIFEQLLLKVFPDENQSSPLECIFEPLWKVPQNLTVLEFISRLKYQPTNATIQVLAGMVECISPYFGRNSSTNISISNIFEDIMTVSLGDTVLKVISLSLEETMFDKWLYDFFYEQILSYLTEFINSLPKNQTLSLTVEKFFSEMNITNIEYGWLVMTLNVTVPEFAEKLTSLYDNVLFAELFHTILPPIATDEKLPGIIREISLLVPWNETLADVFGDKPLSLVIHYLEMTVPQQQTVFNHLHELLLMNVTVGDVLDSEIWKLTWENIFGSLPQMKEWGFLIEIHERIFSNVTYEELFTYIHQVIRIHSLRELLIYLPPEIALHLNMFIQYYYPPVQLNTSLVHVLETIRVSDALQAIDWMYLYQPQLQDIINLLLRRLPGKSDIVYILEIIQSRVPASESILSCIDSVMSKLTEEQEKLNEVLNMLFSNSSSMWTGMELYSMFSQLYENHIPDKEMIFLMTEMVLDKIIPTKDILSEVLDEVISHIPNQQIVSSLMRHMKSELAQALGITIPDRPYIQPLPDPPDWGPPLPPLTCPERPDDPWVPPTGPEPPCNHWPSPLRPSLEGDTVNYYCRPGYELVGDDQLTCTASGRWDGRPPVCEKFTPTVVYTTVEEVTFEEATTEYATMEEFTTEEFTMGEFTMEDVTSEDFTEEEVTQKEVTPIPGNADEEFTREEEGQSTIRFLSEATPSFEVTTVGTLTSDKGGVEASTLSDEQDILTPTKAVTTVAQNPTSLAQNPTTKVQNLITVAQGPTTEGQNPTTVAQDPTTEGQNPTTVAQDPTTEGQNLVTVAQGPTTEGQNPTTVAQDPTTERQNPSTVAEDPITEGQNSITVAQDPTTAAEHPTTAGQNPTSAVQIPTIVMQNPTTEEQNPSAPDRSHTPFAENPTTGANFQSTAHKDFTTAAKRQTTPEEIPFTVGVDPSTALRNPTTVGGNPTTGGRNPTTTGRNPTTGGRNRTTASRNPSTVKEVVTTHPKNPTTQKIVPTTADGVQTTVQAITTEEIVRTTVTDLCNPDPCTTQANSVCVQLTALTFKCQCLPGFFDMDGACQGTQTFVGSLRVTQVGAEEAVFSEELTDTDSEAYQSLAADMNAQIDTIYLNSDVAALYQGNTINGFSNGSIVVDYTVNLEEMNNGTETLNTTYVADVFMEAYEEVAASGMTNLTVDTSAIVVEDFDECQSADTNDCSTNSECINTMGSFTCACFTGYIDDSPQPVLYPGRVCREPGVCPSDLPNNCSVNATCYENVNSGGYTCICNNGFEDMYQELSVLPGRACVESCPDQYCLNGGVCAVVSTGGWLCQCEAGFVGSRCEMEDTNLDDKELVLIIVSSVVGFLIVVIVALMCLVCFLQAPVEQPIKPTNAHHRPSRSNDHYLEDEEVLDSGVHESVYPAVNEVYLHDETLADDRLRTEVFSASRDAHMQSLVHAVRRLPEYDAQIQRVIPDLRNYSTSSPQVPSAPPPSEFSRPYIATGNEEREVYQQYSQFGQLYPVLNVSDPQPTTYFQGYFQ